MQNSHISKSTILGLIRPFILLNFVVKMSESEKYKFTLPDRLRHHRKEGQYDGSKPPRKQKRPKYYFKEDEQLQSDIHIPKQSIYGDDINQTSKTLSEPSRNVLSVIGVLPSQADLVYQYFEEKKKNDYTVELSFSGFDPKYTDRERNTPRGNWIYLKFNKDVELIEIIKPTIQIAPHLIVSCFVGVFTEENVYAVPIKEEIEEITPYTLYRIPPLDENVVATPLETKSYLTLFREFIIGEQEIPRKRSTIPSLLYSIYNRS